jgi:3-oxoadipate enol-lactonase
VRWLLLHGTPLTPAVWDGARALLEKHGTVAAPMLEARESADHLQAELAARVVAETGAGPWRVVGHSFGGQVALEISLGWPDLVSTLTLLCTRDTPFPPFAAAADNVAHGRTDIDGTLRRWFSSEELDADGPAVGYARTALRDADLPSAAAALRAISTYDRSAATPSIACPTRIVAAEHDAVSSPATMEAMHRRIAGSDFVVLPGAWHMSVFTDPVRLAGLLSG